MTEGRWAYTPVLSSAREFSAITNPHGLLRSPWNTNPTPYLTRHDTVLGLYADEYSLPTCDDFSTALAADDWLGTYISALNGKLHGPVHIMIGGHWFSDFEGPLWFGNATGDRSRVLLASKYMWRQGYVRCPEYCSPDAPEAECVCSCPSDIIGDAPMRDAGAAREVLNVTGVLNLAQSWAQDPPTAGRDMSYSDVLKLLCHVGHPGEMFTSAAPQDPLFWPLHGNAERFMTLVRAMAYDGEKALDETWGYQHVRHLMSDTHGVCDWTGVTGMELPTCTAGPRSSNGASSCSGHRADDLLPFTGLWAGQSTKLSNAEFYDFVAPTNTEMPYVYDKVSYWPACPEGKVYYGADYVPPGGATDDLGVVGAMRR